MFFLPFDDTYFCHGSCSAKKNHHGAGWANHCVADASFPRPSPDCLSKGSYDHFVNEGRWVTITRHSIHLGCASQSNKGVAARMSVPSIQDLPHTYRHRRARFKPMLPCSCPLLCCVCHLNVSLSPPLSFHSLTNGTVQIVRTGRHVDAMSQTVPGIHTIQVLIPDRRIQGLAQVNGVDVR